MKIETTYLSYSPDLGCPLPHDPVKAIIAPRPIAWVSTVNESGVDNLAPYSFFNMFSSAPLIVGFASEGVKDSPRNARQTGEFVVNIVSRKHTALMKASSGTFHLVLHATHMT
jgi:flavin reductase (DIM6/NTAB) family NADH-FMN oxidoreductase RutF